MTELGVAHPLPRIKKPRALCQARPYIVYVAGGVDFFSDSPVAPAIPLTALVSGRSRSFAHYFREHVFRSKLQQPQRPRPAGSSTTSVFL